MFNKRRRSLFKKAKHVSDDVLFPFEPLLFLGVLVQLLPGTLENIIMSLELNTLLNIWDEALNVIYFEPVMLFPNRITPTLRP